MKSTGSKRAFLASAAMLATAGAASFASSRLSQKTSVAVDFSLNALIPDQFGQWKRDVRQVVAVVNPQMQKTLDTLYSQILTRQYMAPDGYRILVSMAYGRNQKGDLQAHRPEVCYPAQGFQLIDNTPGDLVTASGSIPVRRLKTEQGARKEPVTYWFTMGDQVVNTQLQGRLIGLRYAFTGLIPDGLLVRLSSIDPQAAQAFSRHTEFAGALLSALSPSDRRRISGIA
jgi:EpsI family protein